MESIGVQLFGQDDFAEKVCLCWKANHNLEAAGGRVTLVAFKHTSSLLVAGYHGS